MNGNYSDNKMIIIVIYEAKFQTPACLSPSDGTSAAFLFLHLNKLNLMSVS